MKVCSIIPQIYNRIGYVDSELFKEIETGLKSNLKGKDLRVTTKSVYEFFKSNEFKNLFGDWELYRAIKYNNPSNEQLLLFSKYYNNDINILKDSILIDLNSLDEPIYSLNISNVDFISKNTIDDIDSSYVKTITNDFLERISSKLNITKEEVLKYLISKNITVKYKNSYYTNVNNVKDRVAYDSNSIGTLYNFNNNPNIDFNKSNLSNNAETLNTNFDSNEINFLCNIVSNCIIPKYDEFRNIASDSNLTSNLLKINKINEFIVSEIEDFRDSIIESLESKFDDNLNNIERSNIQLQINNIKNNYNTFINEFLKFDEVTLERSFLYRSVLSYLKKNFDINIKDTSSLYSYEEDNENGEFVSSEINRGNFDDSSALKINLQKNVAQNLKFELAQSVIKDFTKNINNVTNISSKYGTSTSINIDDIWSSLMSISINYKSFDDVINALKNVNHKSFNGALTTFINKLLVDTKLRNAYISSVSLSIVPVETLNLTYTENGNAIILKDSIKNTRAFANNLSFLQIQQLIQINLENDSKYVDGLLLNPDSKGQYFYNTNKSVNENIKLINELSNVEKLNYISTIIKRLGLSNKLSIDDIKLNILDQLKLNIEYLKDFDSIISIPENQLIYTRTISDIIKSLNYLIDDLIKVDKGYKSFKNKKSKSKFLFQQSFNQQSSLHTLANIASINNYNSTNLTYYNENGDMEYSPQHPSFLTKFFDAISPRNGKVDFKYLKLQLKDYLADPLLSDNLFLYNYDNNGLLNIKKENGEFIYDINGIPIIDELNPINEIFISNFKYGNFSGMTYTDTGVSGKYVDIFNDNWSITQLQAALRGHFFIPSSDSSRSYFMKTMKYGLRNFQFGENGELKSYSTIIEDLKLFKTDKDGNKIRRTVKDLTDDSKFYFSYKDYSGENNDILETIGYTRTIKELKNIVDNESQRVNSLKNILFTYVNSIMNQANNIVNDSFLLESEKRDFLKYENDITITNSGKTFSSYFKFYNSKTLNTLVQNDFDSTDINDYKKALFEIYNTLLGVSRFNFEGTDIEYINDIRRNKKSLLNPLLPLSFLQIESPYINELDNYFLEFFKLENNYTEGTKYLNNYQLLINLDTELLKQHDNYKNSKTIQAIKKSVDKEAKAMSIAAKESFDVNYEIINNFKKPIFKVKDEIQQLANLKKLHSVRDYNGKLNDKGQAFMFEDQNFKTNEGTKPTGAVFYFNRLSYNSKENNSKITLNDYFKKYLGENISQIDIINLILRMDRNTHPKVKDGKLVDISEFELLQDINSAIDIYNDVVYSFIDETFKNRQLKLIDYTKGFKHELSTMIVNSMNPYVEGTSENLKDNGKAKNYSNIISMHSETKVNKDTYVEENNAIDENGLIRGYTKKQIDRQFNKSMLELAINSYIQYSFIGEDLLYGNQYEYKGYLDINKRVNETFKIGRSNNIEDKFNSITINDVRLKSNMLSYFNKYDQGIDAELLNKRYKDSIEVGNGLSIITVKELIKRLDAVDMYYGKMKEYIDDLSNNDNTFNFKKYNYIVEQLKYFLYTRQTETHGLLKGSLSSYQEKNSTIILFPKLFRETDYEVLINWMDKRNINELNFLSGSKVGGQPILDIHDTLYDNNEAVDYSLRKIEHNNEIILDDRLDRKKPYSDDNIINVEDYKVYYRYSDLRIQQDTVSHIEDEKGILATQLIKKIWTSLNPDTEYKIGNKIYKTKTNNYSNRGIFENFQAAYSYNAEQDRDILINAWGGIKNGEIQYNEDGTINLDINKIRNHIQNYYFNSGDISNMKAFESINAYDGNPNMSFNHPTFIKAIENLLQARISKNVKQQLKQIHAPIMPDLFISPKNLKVYNKKDDSIKTDEIIEDYVNKGWISFTNEFIDQAKERNNFDLLADYFTLDNEGNEVFKPAQIITNIWDSKFKKYRKQREDGSFYIDINEIPVESRTVVCTRIPMEGQQSTFVAEVVGFMNTSATQVIVPRHLSQRTGWDYDIDTLYIYAKELYERDNKLYPISYEYDLENKDSIYNTNTIKKIDFVKTYFSDLYNKIETKREIDLFKSFSKYKEDLEDVYAEHVYRNSVIKEDYFKNPNKDNFELLAKSIIPLLNTSITPSRLAIENYIKNAGEINEDFYLYQESLESLINDVLSDDSNSIKTYKDLLENISLNTNMENFENSAIPFTKNELKDIKKQLRLDLKSRNINIQNKYEKDLNSLLNENIITSKFNKLPEIKQLTRKTRDNMLLDSMIAILSNKESKIFIDKPNEFVHSLETSKTINEILNINNSNANFNDISDVINIRNMNINIRNLKGTSVSLDNLWSIFGTLNAFVGDRFAIPSVVMKNEMSTLDEVEQINILNSVIGEGNYKVEEDRYIIISKYLANNFSNNWKNILGNNISEQASEITAQVLDAVKYNFGKNINEYTLFVLSMFANSPIQHNTDFNGSQEANSFVYSNLIIHQPIISKYLKQLNRNQRNGEFPNKNNAIKIVKNDLYGYILSSLYKINLYEKDNVKINIFDIFKKVHLYKNSNDSLTSVNSEQIVKNLEIWTRAINSNKKINFYNDDVNNPTETYNELIKFIKSGNLKTAISDYLKIYNSSEASSIFDKILNSNVISSFENLDLVQNKNEDLFIKIGDVLTISDSMKFKSISELKEMLEFSIKNNYEDIDYFNDDIILQNKEYNKIEYIEFLQNQLYIIKHFEQLEKTYDLISKAQLVLKTDKLGTSNKASIKLFDDLNSLYIDINSFKNQMYNLGYTNNDIIKLEVEYNNAESIPDKIDVLKEQIEINKNKVFKDGNGNTYKAKYDLQIPYTELYVKQNNETKHIVESIFPNYVENTTNDDYVIEKSSYPIFESQLIFANKFSTISLSNVLITENKNFKALLNSVLTNLNINKNIGITRKNKLIGDITSSIIGHHIFNNVPFFNGGTESEFLRQQQVLKVLGKVSIANGKGISTIEFENNQDEFLRISTIPDLESYSKLSAANQIYLLQNNINDYYSYSEINDIDDIKEFLSILDSQLDSESLKNNGYHKIIARNTSKDVYKMQFIFKKMFLNNNPFIRQTARDLIRYIFYTNGLNFSDLSKYIEPSVYYENFTQYEEFYENDKQRLYHYNEQLKQLTNIFSSEITPETIDMYTNYIRKQYFDDNIINPIVKKINKDNSPTFNNYVIYDTVMYPIIKESKTKVNNSRYSNNTSIRTKINYNDESLIAGFKRIDFENSPYYYYIPFTKTLQFEYFNDGSVIEKYVRKFKNEEFYIDLANKDNQGNNNNQKSNVESLYDSNKIEFHNQTITSIKDSDYVYSNKIQQSKDSYSTTAKKIIDNSDLILYIGSNKIYRNAFKSEKTIFKNFDELNINSLNEYVNKKELKLAIVGDSISDNNLSQKEIDDIVIPYVRLFNAYFDIKEITTIMKKGVGESVYKATFTNNRNKQYIEIGEKDKINNYESLDTSTNSSTLLFTSELTIDSVINQQTEIFKTIERLHEYLQRTQYGKPDTIKFKYTDTIIKNMNIKETQMASLMNALSVNSIALNRIGEFILNDIIKMPNGESLNIFTIDIQKYISSNDISVKTLIANKLLLYTNLIQVAKSINSLKSITIPNIGTDEYKLLSENEREYIDGIRNEIKLFNDTLSSIRTSFLKDSLGKPLIEGRDLGSLSSSEKEMYSKRRMLELLESRIHGLRDTYFATLMSEISRNPKFLNSKFNKLINKIKSSKLDEIKEFDITINPQELAKIFETAMLYNNDLTEVNLRLDSVQNTGLPIIDNTFTLFTNAKINAFDIQDKRLEQLNYILERYYKVNDIKFEYKESRSIDFRNKFINIKNGKLISKYNMSKFNNEVRLKRKERFEFINLNSIIDNGNKNDILIKQYFDFKDDNTIDKINNIEFSEGSLSYLIATQAVSFKYILKKYNSMSDKLKSENENNITYKLLNKFLNENEIKDSNLDDNYRYFKLFDFKENEEDKNKVVLLKLTKDLSFENESIRDYIYISTSKGFNNINEIKLLKEDYLKDDYAYDPSVHLGKLVTLQVMFTEEEVNNYFEEYNKKSESEKESLDKEVYNLYESSREYYKYINIYNKEKLLFDAKKRRQFENKYGIQFDDPLASIEYANLKEGSFVNTIPAAAIKVRTEDNIVKIKKIIPNDKFLDKQYEKLNKEDIEFLESIKQYMDEIIYDAFPNKVLSDSFIPTLFLNSSSNISQFFKELFNLKSIEKENVGVDVFNRPVHYLKSKSLTTPNIKNIIKLIPKEYDTSYGDYQIEALKDANEQLKKIQENNLYTDVKEFETIEEVYDFNEKVIEDFSNDYAGKINYDIANVLKQLTLEMYNLKSKVDFQNIFKLLLNLTADNLSARRTKRTGNFVKDMTSVILTGKAEWASLTGTETNAWKRIDAFQNAFYDINKVHTPLDQAMSVLLRVTSLNVMALNWRGGYKNVMKGISDEWIEFSTGEYGNRKQFGKALNEYRKNISSIVASIVKKKPMNDVSSIILYHGDIFNDHSEGKMESSGGSKLHNIAKATEAISYSTNSAGEHLLQFTTLLTMMASHRVVNGVIMSENEYINNRVEQVARQIFSKEFMQKYDDYVESKKDPKKMNGWEDQRYLYKDFINQYLSLHINELTEEERQLYVDKFTDNKSKGTKSIKTLAKEEFNSTKEVDGILINNFKTVREHYIFENGKLIIDANLNRLELSRFIDRVKAVNESMHGIYDNLNRSMLQDTMLGEIAFQFRKWMYPTWIRWMGDRFSFDKKHSRNTFNERLGKYRNGAFDDFFRFMNTPYMIYKEQNGNKHEAPLIAFKHIIREQIKFLKNIKFHWHVMTPAQQNNIIRTGMFAGNFITIILLLYMVGALYDADDDKNKVLQTQLYMLAGLETEYMDIIPMVGWINFYRRTKQNIVPAERQVTDLIKLFENVLAYPFRDDSERIYKRGIYKGEDKIQIQLEKLIPYYRQLHKELYLESSINYYNMYNPIINMMN